MAWIDNCIENKFGWGRLQLSNGPLFKVRTLRFFGFVVGLYTKKLNPVLYTFKKNVNCILPFMRTQKNPYRQKIYLDNITSEMTEYCIIYS